MTAKPGVTTLVRAENHIKTNSSGLQYQAQCCYEQEDSSLKHDTAPFSLYHWHTITFCTGVLMACE